MILSVEKTSICGKPSVIRNGTSTEQLQNMVRMPSTGKSWKRAMIRSMHFMFWKNCISGSKILMPMTGTAIIIPTAEMELEDL